MWTEIKRQTKQIIQRETDSMDDFKYHIRILVDYTFEKRFTKSEDVQKLVIAIKRITHFAIIGDQKCEIFEYFMEADLLLRLFDLMQLASSQSQIVQEVFESVSSLLLNVRDLPNRNYILSHSCIGSMISWRGPFDRSKPIIEIVETYISFLNLLAVKVDEITSLFFINIKHPHFPLLWNAIRFYNHEELMVRNKSRSIVLNIIRVKNPNIQAYIISFPFISYYYNLGDLLIDTMKNLNFSIQTIMWNFDQSKWDRLQSLQEEIMEEIQYLNDLIQNDSRLIPLICQYSLQRPIQFIAQVIKFGFPHLQMIVSLQILSLMLYYFKEPEIQCFIVNALKQGDKQKIESQSGMWCYHNYLDLDQQLMFRVCMQIYSTLQIYNFKEIKHENFDIRLGLQNLRNVEQICIENIDNDDFFNILKMHDNNGNNLYFILQIIDNINLKGNIIDYLRDILLQQQHSLIVKLKVIDILIKKQYDFTQLPIQNILIQNAKQLINAISIHDLISILNTKIQIVREEFALTMLLKLQSNQSNFYFLQYPQLNLYQQLLYNQLISIKIGSILLPTLDSLRNKQYQLHEQINLNQCIQCYLSDTGHFYSMDISYIVNVDQYLHIVQINEQQIIIDIEHSKLWQLIQLDPIELVSTIQITYKLDQKFYLKFKNDEDMQTIFTRYQQNQNSFLQWYALTL